MPESSAVSSGEALPISDGVVGHMPRRLVRMALITGWTGAWFVAWGTITLVTLPAPPMRRRWRAFCFTHWARGVLLVLGVRVTLEGRPPAEGPFVLVTNHLSYLDVIVLAMVTRTRFVAKSEVRSWPVWGFLARMMGTIFIDRQRRRDTARVSDTIEDALTQGDGVAIFPEGTSTRGSEVGPFRSSLLEAACRSAAPVYSAGLSYRTPPEDPPAHLAVCWWGDMEFGPHFWDLTGLSRIDALVRFGSKPVRGTDRKELARTLQRLVSDNFTPVVEDHA